MVVTPSTPDESASTDERLHRLPAAPVTRPELRWLFASYAHSLAVRDSVRCRRLIESLWYQDRWQGRYQLTSDQNRKERFENSAGGQRIASSVGGSATGEGGDIIMVDDPIKIEEASSAAVRQTAVDWFDGTIRTRLNDPAAGAMIVIGQRVHERDLFGHLIAEGGWEHLCLPAEYEPNHPFLWPGDPRTTAGELLWPERFHTDVLADLKRGLGSYGTASQLQQRPAPAGGGIFQTGWFRFYDPKLPLPMFERIVQSWDLTRKACANGPGGAGIPGRLEKIQRAKSRSNASAASLCKVGSTWL